MRTVVMAGTLLGAATALAVAAAVQQWRVRRADRLAPAEAAPG